MKSSQRNTAANSSELGAAILSNKMDYGLKSQNAESTMANVLMEPLAGYNSISVSILIGFALSYADSRKPSIAELYGRYRTKVELDNSAHADGEAIPVLSKHIFRNAIDRLDPAFVLIARYGSRASNKHYVRRLHSDHRRAAKRRTTQISKTSI
ncbi:hypothetical protein HFO58_31935 [Rhizobium leguminosarum]|uniref:hypothetical protein n=1 Tax=Rhizobium leguminosarum TaxID=384 RepID=UPI001C963212|nr:hypothetical protein [Rhizobium leguminosarum]MBY5537704.1 hypothetical protein [Rhizobium leguminosarum]